VASSLKQILQSSSPRDIPDDKLASITINLWKAVKELCTESFEEVEETKRATDYVLLKTTGVFVIHQFLPRLLPYCPTKNGASVLTSDTFKNLLSRAGDLMQSSFWRSSGEGTAGALGTSQKTFATIATLIVERIASRGGEEEKGIKVIV